MVNNMDEKTIRKLDKAIKYIWEHKIPKDYYNGWLLKEDTLKNSIYYHLRKRLGNFFDKNNIRIFTEFTDEKFKGNGYRPDIVIAKVNFDGDSKYYGNNVSECIAVIELKYKKGFNASNDIYKDYEKLKTYVNDLNVDCKLYMATIWEYEDKESSWERKNAAWAKDILTELNASYDPKTKDMKFYISEHKSKTNKGNR